MRITDTKKITIAGAGMAGTLLAILFGKKGFEVDLYEQHADPRRTESGGRQSVDLALGERARHALSLSDLLTQVDALCTPVHGRMIHYRSGELNTQPYGNSDADALYSIRRDRLRQCLLDAADNSGHVKMFFNHQLQNVDWDNKQAIFRVDHGQGPTAKEQSVSFQVLFGADGPVSTVRRAIQRVTGEPSDETLLDSGYKAFSIPADEHGGFRMNPDTLHVWPRGGYMLIAFPDIEGSFSAVLFLPRSGDHKMMWGFEQLDSWIRQRAFMRANFPDAVELIPDLEREFRENPVGLMGTVRCPRWHLEGKALLIGDAAHAMVPFHGQGVNAAFEDCTTLMEILDSGHTDWESAFGELQQQRKRNTDALADMSLDAYQTMRESVRHRDFMLRKALERELERRHPDRFVARYSLVMFHRMPYAEAYQRGKTQSKILDELLDSRELLTDVDLAQADRLIDERLERITSP